MEKILVCVDAAAVPDGAVDALCADVPALVGRWNRMLEHCEEAKEEITELPAMAISAVNSKNFQVIEMLYKVVRAFQREHEYPKQVKIVCPDDESARIYRVVYNFYIPRTKEDRKADKGWD